MSVKLRCWNGHKVGDTFKLEQKGLCGRLYHTLYPYNLMLKYGGSFPDDAANEGPSDRPEFICPDTYNQARIQLRPEVTEPGRHSLYEKDKE